MDRKSKWLLMTVACLVTILNMGLVFSFGSLFVAVMGKFQTNRSNAAAVQSLLVGVTLTFGVVSGLLISRVGLTIVTFISGIFVTSGFCLSYFAVSIYYLYITIGIISATGISMGFISSLTLAGQVFTGTQSLIFISVLNTSISVGALIYPFLLEWLRGQYGILGTFLILGGITCNTFTLFVVCLSNHVDVKRVTSGAGPFMNIGGQEVDGSTLKYRVFRQNVRYVDDLLSVPYVCLLFAMGISVAALNGYVGLLLDISMWKGFSESQGLISMETYHIFGIISRLIPGVIKHKTSISVSICAILSTTSGSIGQLMLYLTSGYVPCVIGTCLSGFAIGGILSSSLILVGDVVRRKQRSLAYGLLYTVDGLLSAVAGYCLGKLRDIYDSYTIVILTIFGSQLIATLLYIIGFLSAKNKLSKEITLDLKEEDLLTSTKRQIE